MDKSHIDMNKLNKVPSGHPFEYRDIVNEDFPTNKHDTDGLRFKKEVESGKYNNVDIISENTDSRVVYKKI